jgi:hypothetical protein
MEAQEAQGEVTTNIMNVIPLLLSQKQGMLS